MKRVTVGLGSRRYDILIGPGLVDRLGLELRRRALGTHPVLVSNATILRRHGARLRKALVRAGLPAQLLTVADSEKAKSLASLSRLLNRLAEMDRPGRRLFLVLAGGGVVGDLGGLAAGLYRRGIPCVQVPTTLLAQVDSSIGGKTAVDLPHGKNLVGLFYQPRLVLSDPAFLRTLPDRQFRSGLAEVIKCGVIADERLFRLLERTTLERLRRDESLLQEVVARAVRVKASVVERDELETKGLRTLLNFGHTFGHAVEAAVGFGRSFTHGEAVALGMQVAADISCRLGRISERERKRIGDLIDRMGLPVRAKGVALSRVVKAMAHDKKWAAGKNRWVLPDRIGHCTVRSDVPERVVRAAILRVLEG